MNWQNSWPGAEVQIMQKPVVSFLGYGTMASGGLWTTERQEKRVGMKHQTACFTVVQDWGVAKGLGQNGCIQDLLRGRG